MKCFPISVMQVFPPWLISCCQHDGTGHGVGKRCMCGSLELGELTPAHHCLQLTVHSTVLWSPSTMDSLPRAHQWLPADLKIEFRVLSTFLPNPCSLTSLIPTIGSPAATRNGHPQVLAMYSASPVSLPPWTVPNPSKIWLSCRVHLLS